MKFKSIGLTTIIFSFVVSLALSYGALAYYSPCPLSYPIDCGGDGWCCPFSLTQNCEEQIEAGLCVQRIGQEPCFGENIYGEHSEEVELLRCFRDEVLSQTPIGQEIIQLYYEMSPAVVQAMEGDEEFKKEMNEMIDGVLPLIKGETE